MDALATFPTFDIEANTPDVAPMLGKLNKLNRLSQILKDAGGINRSIALESAELVPGLINERVPAGFYTPDISKTRYAIALEAVEGEKKSIVARIIDAAVKFFNWVMSKIRQLMAWWEKNYANYNHAGLDGGLERINGLFFQRVDASWRSVESHINNDLGSTKVHAMLAAKGRDMWDLLCGKCHIEGDRLFAYKPVTAVYNRIPAAKHLLTGSLPIFAMQDEIGTGLQKAVKELMTKVNSGRDFVKYESLDDLQRLFDKARNTLGTPIFEFNKAFRAEIEAVEPIAGKGADLKKLTSLVTRQLTEENTRAGKVAERMVRICIDQMEILRDPKHLHLLVQQVGGLIGQTREYVTIVNTLISINAMTFTKLYEFEKHCTMHAIDVSKRLGLMIKSADDSLTEEQILSATLHLVPDTYYLKSER